uniref:Ig-like domain-containing protein n=1 Tax=Xenopus tropicalis TaxID=8364 RepID=K9J7Z2_XENTR
VAIGSHNKGNKMERNKHGGEIWVPWGEKEKANHIIPSLIFSFIITFALFLEEVVRPLVSFSPNWAVVLPGDSVTLSCNLDPVEPANHTYTWYKNGAIINKHQQSFEIQSASWVDRGHYQCQTNYSAKSDSLELEVSYDTVILQVPPRINEGDPLALRCHDRPGFDIQSTLFYKDNEAIEIPVTDSVLHLGKANRNMTGIYKCKGFYHGKMYWSSKRFISVTGNYTEIAIIIALLGFHIFHVLYIYIYCLRIRDPIPLYIYIYIYKYKVSQKALQGNIKIKKVYLDTHVLCVSK